MKSFLKRIIPKFIKDKILSYATAELKIRKLAKDNSIPKYELEEKHFQNLKAIGTRADLLKLMPKQGIVAEIGVANGDFSAQILSLSKPQKLHLIDSWNSNQYPSSLKQEVENRFEQLIRSNEVEINQGLSIDVSEQFDNEYFDWIYLDTSHSYTQTIEELQKYSEKISRNGIISGHDFIQGNWNGMVRYGVIEAVYEFCLKNDWEIIYLTMENKDHPSFAIKKML